MIYFKNKKTAWEGGLCSVRCTGYYYDVTRNEWYL